MEELQWGKRIRVKFKSSMYSSSSVAWKTNHLCIFDSQSNSSTTKSEPCRNSEFPHAGDYNSLCGSGYLLSCVINRVRIDQWETLDAASSLTHYKLASKRHLCIFMCWSSSATNFLLAPKIPCGNCLKTISNKNCGFAVFKKFLWHCFWWWRTGIKKN